MNANREKVRICIEKCRSIRDLIWDSTDSLAPELSGLAGALAQAFNLRPPSPPAKFGLLQVVQKLEKQRIFRGGVSSLVNDLAFELDDTYDEEFESEYLDQVCMAIERECVKVFNEI